MTPLTTFQTPGLEGRSLFLKRPGLLKKGTAPKALLLKKLSLCIPRPRPESRYNTMCPQGRDTVD